MPQKDKAYYLARGFTEAQATALAEANSGPDWFAPRRSIDLTNSAETALGVAAGYVLGALIVGALSKS